MYIIDSFLSLIVNSILIIFFVGAFYLFYDYLYKFYILQTKTENDMSKPENNRHSMKLTELELEKLKELEELERLQQLPLQPAIQTFDWEKQMANLVGFEDSNSEIEETSSKALAIINNNESLPPAPQDIKTQQSLASNPFAKVAFVGASTLVGVLVAGAFLSQMMNGTSQPKKLEQQPIQANNNLNELEETRPEAQIEQLKTKLALAEQANAVKAAQNQLKTFSPPQPIATPTTTASVTPPKTITRVVVQKVPTPAPTVYVPKIVTVDRVIQAPPQQVVQYRPAPNPSQRIVTTRPINSKPFVPSQVASTKPNLLKPVLPKLQPVSPQVIEEIASAKEGVDPSVLNRQDTAANLLPTPVTIPTPVNQTTQTRERSEKSIAVGTSVKAVLATAIFGETNKPANSNTNDSTFVIRLKQPLKNIEGAVALPQNTELLAQIRNISDSGMLQLNVTSVIRQENNKLTETTLPESAIKIRAPKGRPLIANKYPDRGRSIVGMDAGLFVLGGIAKAAELSNRTDSQVLTTVGGNIVTQTSKPNVLTGVLEGGMNSVVPQITIRNQQAISEMTTRGNIWLLKAGTELEVYINQPIQF
jgi:Bacterial conjugation TrbI-like protein